MRGKCGASSISAANRCSALFSSESQGTCENEAKDQNGAIPNETCGLLEDQKKDRPQNCLAQKSLKFDGITLRIEKQKNEVKNKTIFHESKKSCSCPVKMLVQIVTSIRKNLVTPIPYYADTNTGTAGRMQHQRTLAKLWKTQQRQETFNNAVFLCQGHACIHCVLEVQCRSN